MRLSGFSRDHCGAFTGSRSYLADFTNSTKAGVDKALKSLIQKNLLEKKDFVNHGIKIVFMSQKRWQT